MRAITRQIVTGAAVKTGWLTNVIHGNVAPEERQITEKFEVKSTVPQSMRKQHSNLSCEKHTRHGGLLRHGF